MSRIYQLVANMVAWWLDYAYAAYWQVRGFYSRSTAATYRHADTQLVAKIVLVPGVYEHWRFLTPIAKLLRRRGFDVHVIDQLLYNTASIEQAAADVDEYISSHLDGPCIIVAHSKGGLIGKYILTHYNAAGRVAGMVALCTPFSGSRYAAFLPITALRALRPTSKVMLALAANTLTNTLVVSLYSRFDPHIPGGSELPGARNVKLPTRGHFRMLGDRRTHVALLEAIDSICGTISKTKS